MKELLCSSMDLREVPPHLSSSIELLDLSSNRLRSLAADSLSRYAYLRYLYLNDNLLMSVEEGAFSALQLLETVDLSLNALRAVPASLLALPALRRLYLDDNPLSAAGPTGLERAPAGSELHFLSLARCGLRVLPPLAGFWKLHTLNVSGNSLTNLTVGHVAPLCRLAVLDLTGNHALFGRPGQLCDCALLAEWLDSKGVQLARGYSLRCGDDYVPGQPPQQCRADEATSAASARLQECSEKLEALERTARARKAWTTAGIVGGVAAGLLLLVAALAWLRCRRRRRRRRKMLDQRDPAPTQKPLLALQPADGKEGPS
ncbi:leucine-rich repeat-containing protein 24-like isoform X2 [Bacillus rossius redtenbacheri]|uniref:leucine-rich repeat-containing protein 24-like isoform X2 n=1 Tax=Bacillus rossius redtenbacheri TaxID=93214 RepID=UPI002FDE1B31